MKAVPSPIRARYAGLMVAMLLLAGCASSPSSTQTEAGTPPPSAAPESHVSASAEVPKALCIEAVQDTGSSERVRPFAKFRAGDDWERFSALMDNRISDGLDDVQKHVGEDGTVSYRLTNELMQLYLGDVAGSPNLIVGDDEWTAESINPDDATCLMTS